MPFALALQQSSSRWLGCRILVAVLLLVAAALKSYGLAVEPFAQYGWFIGPRTRMAALVWETVLAVWLLSGRGQLTAWSFTVLTFLAFGTVSGYLGWIGRSSCGCFGALQVSPWLVAALDGVVLVLLSVSRPRAEAVDSAAPWWRIHSNEAAAAVGNLVVPAAILGAVVWLGGPPEQLIAKLRGEPLLVSESYVDFGVGKVGERLEASATIYNRTGRPIRLIGGTTDCSCATIRDLPVTIPPGGSAVARIRLKVPADEQSRGWFNRDAYFLTDCADQLRIPFSVGCRVE